MQDFQSNSYNTPETNAEGAQSPAAFDTGNQGSAPTQAGFGMNADGTAVWQSTDGQIGAPVKSTVTVTHTPTTVAPAQDFLPVLPPKPKSAAAIFDAIVELAQARIDWEDNQLRASNNVLYALLDHCYGIYDLTQQSDDIRETFLKIYAAKYPNTKAGTSVATKIIWAVFGKKLGQRAATYSRVLRFARIEIKKTPSLSFRQFLAQFGGIEEVRRSGNNEATKSKHNAKIASATAKLKAAKGLASNIAMLLPDDMQEKNEVHSFRAALLREDADGTFTVVMVSKSEGTVHSMLSEFETNSADAGANAQARPASVQDIDDLAKIIAANANV